MDLVELAAIVTTADDGGSSGVLRDEHGILPAGDVLRSAIALSELEQDWRYLLEYRFDKGSLNGHTLGNVLLAALQNQYGDPLEGFRAAHKLLQVKGNVIPVTARPGTLRATLEDGSVIDGEHNIDESPLLRSPIKSCALVTDEPANPEAIKTIESADLIVIGPGDLFTSVIPVLLVPGITQALAKAKAKKVFIVNLMTKRGQTDKYTAQKFVTTVSEYAAPATLDFVVINTARPSDEIVARYAEEGEEIVEHDFVHKTHPLQRVVTWPLIAREIVAQVSGDRLRRSLIRHDPLELARAILSLIRE
jgi:uncharacterized cofD-like protein